MTTSTLDTTDPARPATGQPSATTGPTRAALPTSARVAELSYFFPAHNEEANLPGLVAEALETLPGLAERFEIVIVDDGSRDATPRLADELAAAHPEVRAVHHRTNLGYGAALRSGFAASRYEILAFTDGDRQFRVADLGRLLATLAPARLAPATPAPAPPAPVGPAAGAGRSGDLADIVVGYRIRRADPLVRTVYARLYRLANRIFFGLRVTDVDCACKAFRRASLAGIAVESGGAFFSAELLIKLQAAGHRIAEVGVPHYPRVAGSATGARPSVVLRAVRDFWSLRLRLWVNPRRALRRGRPILGSSAG